MAVYVNRVDTTMIIDNNRTDDICRQIYNIRRKQIPKTCFVFRLAVVFAQSIEARR